MKSTKNSKRQPRGADSDEEIGFSMITKQLFKLIGFIIVIGFIIITRPAVYWIMLIISAWVIIQNIWYKKFTWLGALKSLAIINTFILMIYGIYKVLGGWPALILAHVIGVSFILWGNRHFIRRAQAQFNSHAIKLKKKFEGEEDGT